MCWYGEVPTDEFITGNALANLVGLTEGVSQYSNEPWLQFTLDGSRLFVAKKTYRRSVSWEHLNNRNLVYGNRTVVVKNRTYQIRLLKGLAAGKNVNDVPITGYDDSKIGNSEWNRLMYPIHSGIHRSNIANPSQHSDVNSLPFKTFAEYSELELSIDHSIMNSLGSRTICMDNNGVDCIVRGNAGVTHFANVSTIQIVTTGGWRPVLELVP